ncbi:MAG: HAMP domain-containing sensor histidine kinase [Bacteroidales bacterium]|nr:HAMP domain-containing sensor histidine kinase [Bacteroidales bacterium]
MKLELKLAIIGAISKIAIFLVFLVVLEQLFGTIATHETDNDLGKMKDKTLAIVNRIGIRSFLKEEQDSAYASYNMLKEEYISLNLTSGVTPGKPVFSTVMREIEGEEFNYRILTYDFQIDNQTYRLEIGRNIQFISGFRQAIQRISIGTIILVLIMTILLDIWINKKMLKPLNQVIIPKLRTTTNPESFVYSEIKTTTTDFAYLNNVINGLMRKVSTSLTTQKKFIANVSHELMTPVSVIQSKLENFATSPQLPQKLSPAVIDIQYQINRLQQIIKALLLISRIENDQFPKKETFTVFELIEEISSDIEDRVAIKNLSFENQVDRRFRIMDINKSLIQIMMFNLVSNAIKYNRDGGYVRITSNLSNQGLTVAVSDSGIGIKADQVPFIFDRFKRIRPEVTEGFGLGLSIVKAIADYHHLATEVASVEGEGSVFKVIFPLIYVKES